MLSFCTFTFQFTSMLSCEFISSQWCEFHEHMWGFDLELKLSTDMKTFLWKRAPSTDVTIFLPRKSERRHQGSIFHATCIDFLIFNRVWPSKVRKRIIRPCHFISTCGASSCSISMLHFSKKLILSDSNSLVQEPEMQVTTATLAQHNNTFIPRQNRFHWFPMYLCIGSVWRWWNVQCDIDDTHKKILRSPFWLWDLWAHTKCFAALPRHEPPLWSSTAAGLLRLTGMVEVRPTVARSLPTDRRIRKIDNPKAFNELQHNFLKQSATVKMRRQRTYWKSFLEFTRTVETLHSDSIDQVLWNNWLNLSPATCWYAALWRSMLKRFLPSKLQKKKLYMPVNFTTKLHKTRTEYIHDFGQRHLQTQQ